MPENQQSDRVGKNATIPDDEINLIELIGVIWKWKYLILIGTIICALAGAFSSYKDPKIYQAATLLKIHRFKAIDNFIGNSNLHFAF